MNCLATEYVLSFVQRNSRGQSPLSPDARFAESDPVIEPGSTAQHQAYCHIRRKILTGAIGPGERINLAEVADALQVSRMPVREALRHLDAEGLVVMRPNRGASVIDLTPAEAEEYFQIRAALEGLAVCLAVPHLTDDDVEQLVLAKERMDRAKDEPPLWLDLHRRFHVELHRKCGRQRLIREVRRVTELLTPIAAQEFITNGVNLTHVHDHDQILQKMMEGDAEGAEEAVRRHILSVGNDMVKRMEASEDQRASHAYR
jgi:DNA-binding GntR family transcriptional regulator